MWWCWWLWARAAEPDPPAEPAPSDVPAEPAPPAAPAPPPPAPTVEPSMRGHFEKATTAMLAAALGQMDEVRTSARALSEAPGVPPNLAAAAATLAKCGRVPCATDEVAELARTCADCHLETGHGPRPRNMTSLPGSTPREKHIYAATFAWVGLVTPKQPLFLFGLANVVPPVDALGGSKALGQARDAFRTAQQAAVGAESLEARSAAFAGLLDACVGCHEVSGVPGR